MLEMKKYLNRRLTARQTVAIVALIAALAGLGYLSYTLVSAKILEAKVKASLPKVCAGIRDQRRVLVNAIEAYKTQFGFYPPDHVVSRQPLVVDAITNTLLYELAGVTYDPTNKEFQVGHLERADAKYVKEFFQCDGFKNCAENSNEVKHFLPDENPPVRQLHDDPDVFALSFPLYSEAVDPQVMWEFQVSSWRYISSNPTNNAGKFDLWIELKTKNQTVTIGNWKTVE